MGLIKRYLGDVVAGVSVAAGMLIVAPDLNPLSWSFLIGSAVIVFGVAIGDALCRRYRSTGMHII